MIITKSLESFYEKTEIVEECLEWTGTRRNNYGIVTSRPNSKSPIQATHIAWFLQTGEVVPDGKFLLHSCDNPPCVLFDHLFVGTHEENMLDMYDKGRRQRAKPYTPKSDAGWRFSLAEIYAIREALEKDKSWGCLTRIARRFDTSPTQIASIRDGKLHASR